MEQIEKLYGICDELNNKFSGNNNPYMILSRLLEESGELASAVHHIEKRGEPSKENLTKEVFDVERDEVYKEIFEQAENFKKYSKVLYQLHLSR